MPSHPPRYNPPHLARQRAEARLEAQRRYDQGARQDNPVLRQAKRIRSSAAWQRFRTWFLAPRPENPYGPRCADPFGRHGRMGVIALADDVHHVRGLAEAPHLALDPDNCRPLCRACHVAVEAEERAGRPTQHLFAPPT